jgi:hypothetical protein
MAAEAIRRKKRIRESRWARRRWECLREIVYGDINGPEDAKSERM